MELFAFLCFRTVVVVHTPVVGVAHDEDDGHHRVDIRPFHGEEEDRHATIDRSLRSTLLGMCRKYGLDANGSCGA